jgi:hypothetical protein
VASAHAGDDGVKAFADWLRAEGAISAGLSAPLAAPV